VHDFLVIEGNNFYTPLRIAIDYFGFFEFFFTHNAILFYYFFVFSTPTVK
jgi:hypothetical protein